jgi:Methylase involved in ubiquinone/menaquinone biosynthesis
VDKKTEQSRSRYNLLAQQYDDSFDGKFTLPFNQYLCDNIALSDNCSVLDVACGNGRLLKMLSKKARIRAFGIDVSEEMVTAAQSSFKDATFRVSPADKIDFPDSSFDFITVCCAFHHFTKPAVFLKEASRVLKNDGRLVIADPSPITIVRWIQNLVIPFMNMGDVKIYTVKELYKFYTEAGFKSISHAKKSDMVVIEGLK